MLLSAMLYCKLLINYTMYSKYILFNSVKSY